MTIAAAAAAGCVFQAPPFPCSGNGNGKASWSRARLCPGPSAAPSGRAAACSASRRRCECFDLHQQIVPFTEAWAWQKDINTRRRLLDTEEDHSDTLLALQHPPVYTLGTGTTEDDLRFNVEDAPFEIHRIDRGGKVTYHGPGQLVMYPILNLRYHKELMPDSSKENKYQDLHWYMESLEKVIIRALHSAFFIKATRIKGLTGVWVGDQKVAAIGIHARRWITYHGLALNVTTDLTPFQHIVPCGIKDRGVVSVKEILQKASVGIETDETALMDMAYNSLLKEFAEFFQLSIDLSPDCNLLEQSDDRGKHYLKLQAPSIPTVAKLLDPCM